MAGNPGRFQFELVLSGLAQYVLNLRQFLVPARDIVAIFPAVHQLVMKHVMGSSHAISRQMHSGMPTAALRIVAGSIFCMDLTTACATRKFWHLSR